MKKKLIFSFIILVVATTFFATGVYAFFTGTVDNPISSSISSTEEVSTVEINNEYELRQYSFDRYYNPNKDVSDSQGIANLGQRTSLVLAQNITLSYDLIINRDIAFNLAGYTLNLNGHTLKIEHYYYGTLIIRNGTVSSGGEISNIIYNTPNATIDDSTTTFTNISKSVLSQNENALTSRVFDYVASQLDDFYNKDINLVKNYYNSEITFEWTSNNVSLVSHSGKIATLPIIDTVVEFSLKLSHNDFIQEYTNTYSITIIASSEDRLDYGEADIEEFFDKYRYGKENIYIYNSIELPSLNEYYNLDYIHSTLVAEDLTDGFIINRGEVSRKVDLQIIIDNNIGGTRVLSYELNVVLENNLDIANNIVKGMDIFLISNIESTIELPLIADLEPYGISHLSDYIFINNNNNYSIVDNQIVVNNLPETEDEIYITFGFNFVANIPEYVERDVRIFYVDASGMGGDESLDRYSYLYYLLNEMITQKTAGITYNDFTMPSELLGYGVEYLLEEVPNDAIVTIGDASITLFDFDTTLVPPEDTTIRINYLFEGAEELYSRDSFFILPGIINNNSNGIVSDVLYNAILLAYDENQDEVLTIDEGVAHKNIFVVSDYATGEIASYKGIEYLKNTHKFDFSNYNFNKSDMVHLKNIQGITDLSMKNCGITNDDINMFNGLNFLVFLDLGENSITNLSSLNLPNTVSTIYLNNNALTSIEWLTAFKNLQNIYLHNNSIKLYEPLLKMNNLSELTTYSQSQPIIDLYYGPKGRNNTSTYILLTKKNVSVYNDYINDEKVLFSYDNDQSAGAAILESIKLYGYSQTTIEVPVLIYETLSKTFAVNWDNSNFSGVSTTTTNGIMTITHSNAIGAYELYASVTVNGKITYKIFIIEVVA